MSMLNTSQGLGFGDFVSIGATNLTGFLADRVRGDQVIIRTAAGADITYPVALLHPATRQEYTREVLGYTYQHYVRNPSASHYVAHQTAMLDYQDATHNDR